jgi:hypothetical protein
MSLARFQICKVFENLEHLLFSTGVFLGTSPMDCTRVLFWQETGMVREIINHKGGRLQGFQGSYYTPGHPESLLHYKHGNLFGEGQFCTPRGNLSRHVLFLGQKDKAVPFSTERAREFSGYRFSREEWDLPFEYHELFVKGWYKP